MSRPHTREGHNLQNLTNFANIFVFAPLNLLFPPKCTGNRFSIAWPTCPFAGLLISPIGSKVMADCRVTHRTSPCFFVGLHIVPYYFVLLSCSTTTKMSHLLPLLEWAIPIVSIVTTGNVQAYGKHCFGCHNTLMLAWNAHGFGGLLHWPRNGTRQTHHFSQ